VEIYCGCKVQFYLGWLVFFKSPWVTRSGALEEY